MVASNTVFNIYFDNINDDGSEVQDYLVVQPKSLNDDGVAGIAVLPIFDDKIGLVHIHRHPINETIWEVPRGFIEEDETVIQAAQRELREEAGLFCELRNFEIMGAIAPEPGVINAKVETLVANECCIVDKVQYEELGQIGFQMFTLEEVATLIARGEIIDPFTITLYYKIKDRLISEVGY